MLHWSSSDVYTTLNICSDKCQTYCGMLRAADEGIANITMRLKERNLLDDTITTDIETDLGG